jgi:hypothetical protein
MRGCKDVSYSANRRNALDAAQPMDWRAHSARSCAVLVAEKHGVKRSVVLSLVVQRCGVDLLVVKNDAEIRDAFAVLDELRVRGVDSAENDGGQAISN